MDNTTFLGAIGEAKAIAKLTEARYHVFNQVTGKAPFDLVAYKDGALFKVSVKAVHKTDRYGNYTVQLKSVRPNRTGNKIINFDNTSCDLLCIYIVPTDEVHVLNACNISAKSSLTIKAKPVAVEG